MLFSTLCVITTNPRALLCFLHGCVDWLPHFERHRAGEAFLFAAEILESEKKSFARTMTLEMGKPINAAVQEAEKCAWVCRYYAESAEKHLADEIVETNATKSFVRYQPLGVVLAVMPWNFPFW